MNTPRNTSRFATVLLLLFFMFGGQAAWAHDQLISSNPKQGEEVSSPLTEMVFEYSSPITPISPVVRITGSDGNVAFEGTPEVDGTKVTAKLSSPLPAGEAKAAWRVVSSDGHPINGVVTFRVSEAAGEATSSSASSASEPLQNSTAGEKSETTPASESNSGVKPVDSTAKAPHNATTGTLISVVAIIVILGAVGYSTYRVFRKRKKL